jgi:ligand-binding sensor domain-containing protein
VIVIVRVVGGVLLLSLTALPLYAQRLAVSAYSVGEGLPSAFVERVIRDSRGFVWFATRDGLARFDGHEFVTYGTEHGLGHPTINDILETRSGHYWIATNGGGVFRLDPQPPPAAIAHWDAAGRRAVPALKAFRLGDDLMANRVNRLFEDRKGRIWAGTDSGPWLLDPSSGDPEIFKPFTLQPPGRARRPRAVGSFAEDAQGNIWVGSGFGLFRIAPDGSASLTTINPQMDEDPVTAIAIGSAGDVWAGHPAGLVHIEPLAKRSLTTSDGLSRGIVVSIIHRRDGRLWVLTEEGLNDVGPDGIRTYSKNDGLPDDVYTSLVEDGGQLWIGTRASGAIRINRAGFLTWDTVGGQPLAPVHGLFPDGEAILAVSGDYFISRFDGVRFQPIGRLPLPRDLRYAWASAVAHFDAATGWWGLTNRGVWLFERSGANHHRDAATLFTQADGLVGNGAARMHRDREGRRGLVHAARTPRGCRGGMSRRADSFP